MSDKMKRRAFILVLLCGVMNLPLVAEESVTQVTGKGLEIGAKVPEFGLISQTGGTVRLLEQLPKAPWTVVLFYRSADW